MTDLCYSIISNIVSYASFLVEIMTNECEKASMMELLIDIENSNYDSFYDALNEIYSIIKLN